MGWSCQAYKSATEHRRKQGSLQGSSHRQRGGDSTTLAGEEGAVLLHPIKETPGGGGQMPQKTIKAWLSFRGKTQASLNICLF